MRCRSSHGPGSPHHSGGSGAIAGGLCGATLGLACATANGVAGALQYLASPGDKSMTGLSIAAVGSAALPLSPLLRTRQLKWDPGTVDFNRSNLTWWGRNSLNLWTSVAINLPRSALANLLSGFESTALGAESHK